MAHRVASERRGAPGPTGTERGRLVRAGASGRKWGKSRRR
jgi:hypothetical protein